MTKYLDVISGYTLETFEYGVILKLYLQKIKHKNLLVTEPEAQTTPLNVYSVRFICIFLLEPLLGVTETLYFVKYSSCRR